jgi:hypothetical protein
LCATLEFVRQTLREKYSKLCERMREGERGFVGRDGESVCVCVCELGWVYSLITPVSKF